MTEQETRVVQCAEFFKAVGEPSRVRIIGLLLERPRTVEEVGSALGMGPGLVTHHLARLAAVGLVAVESEEGPGRYRVQADMLATMTKRLLGMSGAPRPSRPHLRLVKPTRSRAGRQQLPR